MSVLLQGHSKGNNPTGHSPGLCSLPSEGGKNQHPKIQPGKRHSESGEAFLPRGKRVSAQVRFICQENQYLPCTQIPVFMSGTILFIL